MWKLQAKICISPKARFFLHWFSKPVIHKQRLQYRQKGVKKFWNWRVESKRVPALSGLWHREFWYDSANILGKTTFSGVLWRLGTYGRVVAPWHPRMCSGTLAPICHTTYCHNPDIRQPGPFCTQSQSPAVLVRWFTDTQFLISV